MKNLEAEIEVYVASKQHYWSPRSVSNARTILHSVVGCFSRPDLYFNTLNAKGLKRYSIKTYFLYAGRFEQEVFGTRKFYDFIKGNSSFFRNCYKEKTRAIRERDFEIALKTAQKDGDSMWNLVTLMGRGGLRWNEALQASWGDIKEDLLWVVGKGDKQRKVPFNKSWLKYCAPKVDDRSLIVDDQSNLRRRFKTLFVPFTPHDFRAYYATQVANNPQLGIKNAAMLLGHSSISTTSRYVRADIEHCRKVLLG